MKRKLSKTQIKKEIEDFFKNIKDKSPKEIKKIKNLAKSINYPLGKKRKLFCKKCFTVYSNPKTRIKNSKKIVFCKNCGYVARWKLNSV